MVHPWEETRKLRVSIGLLYSLFKVEATRSSKWTSLGRWGKEKLNEHLYGSLSLTRRVPGYRSYSGQVADRGASRPCPRVRTRTPSKTKSRLTLSPTSSRCKGVYWSPSEEWIHGVRNWVRSRPPTWVWGSTFMVRHSIQSSSEKCRHGELPDQDSPQPHPESSLRRQSEF